MSPNQIGPGRTPPTCPSVATAQAMADAIGAPWTPHSVERDASATATSAAVLGCSYSRTIIGLKLFRGRLWPVDGREAVARLPVTQAHVVKAGAVGLAVVVATCHFAHAAQDTKFDFGNVRQAHERSRRILGPGACRLRHGTGTRATTSSMTASVVNPWLAACGPSHSR